ncbi:MAG: hypothetical protein M3Z54_09500 [Gemmatimonadota bacterium]|nr:hypothetical protein [Gemmatimonadota bacterium]
MSVISTQAPDSAATSYVVIYDAITAGFHTWWLALLGLIGVAAGFAAARYPDRVPAGMRFPSQLATRLFGVFFLTCALSWTIFAYVSLYDQYAQLRQALQAGTYETVEGTVEDFVPGDPDGHAPERFTVSRHHYEYSPSRVTSGFNKISTHGGPMHAGLRVRIADVGGEIARLEIAR